MERFISLTFTLMSIMFLQNLTKVSSVIINNTLQINFKNETLINDYSNSSSVANITETSAIQMKLTNATQNLTMILSITVSNLTSSGGSIIATVLIKTNDTLDIQLLNNLITSLNAIIVFFPTTAAPTSDGTTVPISSVQSSSMSDTVSTNPSTNIFTTNTDSITSSNLNITTIINTPVVPTTYETTVPISSVQNSSMSETVSTNPSTNIFTNTNSITSSNLNETTIINTMQSTVNSANSDSPGISGMATSINPNLNMTSISNIPQTNTTGNSFSETSTVTPTKVSTTSVTTTSTTITSTVVSTSTTASGNLKIIIIRFINEIWVLEYSDTSSQKYKEKVVYLRNQMAVAFASPISYFTIYSLSSGSIVANTSIPIFITENQIAAAMTNMSAQIENPTTSAPSSTLPQYAVILIAIFVTILIIVIVFIIVALICRHRRLKGYGRQQIEFFEMENGWDYGIRNTVYQDD